MVDSPDLKKAAEAYALATVLHEVSKNPKKYSTFSDGMPDRKFNSAIGAAKKAFLEASATEQDNLFEEAKAKTEDLNHTQSFTDKEDIRLHQYLASLVTELEDFVPSQKATNRSAKAPVEGLEIISELKTLDPIPLRPEAPVPDPEPQRVTNVSNKNYQAEYHKELDQEYKHLADELVTILKSNGELLQVNALATLHLLGEKGYELLTKDPEKPDPTKVKLIEEYAKKGQINILDDQGKTVASYDMKATTTPIVKAGMKDIENSILDVDEETINKEVDPKLEAEVARIQAERHLANQRVKGVLQKAKDPRGTTEKANEAITNSTQLITQTPKANTEQQKTNEEILNDTLKIMVNNPDKFTRGQIKRVEETAREMNNENKDGRGAQKLLSQVTRVASTPNMNGKDIEWAKIDSAARVSVNERIALRARTTGKTAELKKLGAALRTQMKGIIDPIEKINVKEELSLEKATGLLKNLQGQGEEAEHVENLMNNIPKLTTQGIGTSHGL